MRVVLAIIPAFVMSSATPTLAWGPNFLGDQSYVSQVKAKYKWKRGGCKYEYKADKKGFSEKYKCK